jgi:hypothetical protein
MRRIAYLEDQILNLTNSLNALYQLGRTNTVRVAPANSADVVAGFDLLYDRVLTNSAEYILIDNAGTLEWRSVTLNVF